MIGKIQIAMMSSTCLLILAGCVNLKPVPSQTESYILGPLETELRSVESEQSEAIYIVRPQVPTFLDNKKLSYRMKSGEVKSIDGARWAEPLDEGIARTLSLYLSGQEVSYYPWPNSLSDASRLSLNFKRLSATESGDVQVLALWSLKRADGQIISGEFRSESISWVPGQPESLVAAYNQSLRELSTHLSKALK